MELAAYLLHKPLDIEKDPLVWWNTNQGHYPRLSMLTRKYLCITATSSPSERVFSTGGNVVKGCPKFFFVRLCIRWG